VRILLTRLSALGDIVHTWPLAEALRAGRGDLELLWLVERPFACLVEGHPAVDHVVAVSTGRWRRSPLAGSTHGEIRAAVAALRAFEPDLVLDPQGLVKSAIWGRLARGRDRVGLARGWRRELPAGLFYHRTVTPDPKTRHVVDINLAMAGAAGVEAGAGAAPDGRFLLGRGQLSMSPPPGTVMLLPATGGAGKAWGADSFGALASWLLGRGLTPLLTWGPGERPLAEAIASAAGPGAVVAPPTSIVELAELASRCRAVVGGDTGTVHLAASLGVPTLAVFVTTDPARNGPRGPAVRVVAAAAGGSRRDRARTRPGGEVRLAQVLPALSSLLDERPEGT
jgi:heptosyltransferase-1